MKAKLEHEGPKGFGVRRFIAVFHRIVRAIRSLKSGSKAPHAKALASSRIKTRRFRSFTLIEVLIAIALVALTAIPLLYPHYAILKEERLALRTLEVDALAGDIYGEILRDVYRGKIDWAEIQSQEAVAIRSEELESQRLKATRLFTVERSKPQKNPQYFLLRCTITIKPERSKEPSWSYDYFLTLQGPPQEQSGGDEI